MFVKKEGGKKEKEKEKVIKREGWCEEGEEEKEIATGFVQINFRNSFVKRSLVRLKRHRLSLLH